MFTKILPRTTQETLELLGKIEAVNQFYLSGGTACALYLGHRISEDLDFFTPDDFSIQNLIPNLRALGKIKLLASDKNTLHCFLNQTRVSFLRYPYPLIEQPANLSNVRISSLIDILCTKLDTISSRGSKKDFIDVYCAIKKKNYSLIKIIMAFQKKYRGIEYSLVHILKGLIYFEDADKEEMPTMVARLDWENVKSFFETQTRSLQKKLL